MQKRIVITPGEPAGIGPDILIMLAQQTLEHELIAVAAPELLQARAEQLKLPLSIRIVDDHKTSVSKHTAGSLAVIPTTLKCSCTAGQLDSQNARYVLDCLDIATDHVSHHNNSALVTGPIHKGIINDAGIAFTGHTEWLANKYSIKDVVMMLASEQLRVALATTHIPVRQVAPQITKDLLKTKLHILHNALVKQFNLKNPRILVCGLNPHAGEQGHLGSEENDIIDPCLETLKNEGINVSSTLPADTVFSTSVREQADAIFAMYHDQGLAPLKALSFGGIANITLGLPIVRTSVDHGTALNLAGTGKASPNSLLFATKMALTMGDSNVHAK